MNLDHTDYQHPKSALYKESNQNLEENKHQIEREYATRVLLKLDHNKLLGDELDIKERFKIAFAFFHLDRPQAGAREIVNCLQICKFDEKPKMLQEAGYLFESVGDYQSAFACYNEAIIQANTLKDVSPQMITNLKKKMKHVTDRSGISKPYSQSHSQRYPSTATSSSTGSCISENLRQKEFKLRLEYLADVLDQCRDPSQSTFVKNKISIYKKSTYLDSQLTNLDMYQEDFLSIENIVHDVYSYLLCFPSLSSVHSLLTNPKLWSILNYLKLKLSISDFELELPRTYEEVVQQMKQIYSMRSNDGLIKYLSLIDLELKTSFFSALNNHMNGRYADANAEFDTVADCCKSMLHLSTLKEKTKSLSKDIQHTEKYILRQLSSSERERIRLFVCTIGSCTGYFGTACYFQLKPKFDFQPEAGDEDVERLTKLYNCLADVTQICKEVSMSMAFSLLDLTMGRLQARIAFCKCEFISSVEGIIDSDDSGFYAMNENRLEKAIKHYALAVQESAPDDPILFSGC
ncbi:unnamed protein product [Ambrosiozyma monospora]|uniref:Unnamed protein product n=1 Tax=Ambrosiozyma monospora TaxID=43982 RepID=A0A9W6YQY6_AMBMO|nr:unnamed protein product [Ambrosiozyma monospora]